ncbi:MAG: hypothetical protein ABIT36_09720 [Steroidobacteraceae bacterium]
MTLTGVRGLIAPSAGVLFYACREEQRPGSGKLSVLVPLAMTFAGALSFMQMRREHGRINQREAE